LAERNGKRAEFIAQNHLGNFNTGYRHG
jgi:hypothetical protein